MTQAQERLERLIETVRDLPSRRTCWFWMTSGGPDGTPFFVLVEQADDPKGRKFKNRVQWVRENTETMGETVHGVLHRLGSGRYTLTTTAPLERASAIYAYACRFGALPDVLVIQLSGTTVKASRPVENLSALAERVQDIPPAARLWFGITDGPSVRFRTADSRAEIQEELGESAIIGQLRRAETQGFELRVRELSETRPLSLLLQKWSRSEASYWPALQALSSARIASKNPYRLERRDG